MAAEATTAEQVKTIEAVENKRLHDLFMHFKKMINKHKHTADIIYELSATINYSMHYGILSAASTVVWADVTVKRMSTRRVN